MATESMETRAGAPGRFEFEGETYRVAPASAAQYFELKELVKRHVPNPIVETAALLRACGDALTPEERRDLLAEAKEEARPRYVTKVRVFWDDTDKAEASSLIGRPTHAPEASRLTAEDLTELRIPEMATVGQLVTAAWKRSLRPDDETNKPVMTPAEQHVRDALNDRFAEEARQITEQIGGWPPPVESPEAGQALYFGPGLPEVMGVLLPPHNEGLTRKQAEEIGRRMQADPSGKAMERFQRALEGESEADKSGE